MAINAEPFTAGGPGTPARPLVVSRARTSRRILLDRLAFFVVRNREQDQFAGTFHWFLIDGLSTELGEDVVAGSVVTAIDPGEN